MGKFKEPAEFQAEAGGGADTELDILIDGLSPEDVIPALPWFSETKGWDDKSLTLGGLEQETVADTEAATPVLAD